MLRKAFVNSAIILDVLQKCEIFDKNQILKCRSDIVWKEASTKISN